ncbi:MAG: hypothetical protein WC967_12730 [Balneolaceae bacterium]
MMMLKKFMFGTEEISLRKPTRDERNEANKIRNFAMSRMIQEAAKTKTPLLVRAQVNQRLRELGIWTDEDDKAVDDLSERVRNGLEKLNKGGIKFSEGRNIALDVADARQEIFDLMSKRLVLEGMTAESLADSEQYDYLISVCAIYSESGERVFNDLDDFKARSETDLGKAVIENFFESLYGLGEDYETSMPETKWLKENGFLNDEFRLIDRKTGKLVAKDGSPIDDVEEVTPISKIIPSEPFIEDDEEETSKDVPQEVTPAGTEQEVSEENV